MSIPADITLFIAEPPSANRMYRQFQGRMLKSKEYRAWKDGQALAIAYQLSGARIEGAFAAYIAMPSSRKDLDNRVKPLLDALQAGGAFANDKACRRLTLEVDESRESNVLVQLWAVEAPPRRTRARKLRMAVPVEPLART